MYMVKVQKFCNNNNDDNLNNKGNSVLCTLHLMSDAFGIYNLKKKLWIFFGTIITILDYKRKH